MSIVELKPTGQHVLAAKHAFKPNVYCFFLDERANTDVVDLVSGEKCTVAGTASSITTVVNEDGRVLSFDGVADASLKFPAGDVVLTASEPWEITWRVRVGDVINRGMVLGTNGTGSNYIWMRYGSYIQFENSVGTQYNFTGAEWGVRDLHTYSLVSDGGGTATGTLTLYVDGEISQQKTLTTGSITAGHIASTFFGGYSLKGEYTHIRVSKGTTYTDNMIRDLHADLYQVLKHVEYNYLSASSLILVSNTFSFQHEVLGVVSKTNNVSHEAMQSVNAPHTLNIESLQRVAQAQQIQIESLQNILQVFSVMHESLASVSNIFQCQIESLQSLLKIVQVEYESLQSVSQTRTIQIESLGSAAVSATHVMQIESSGYVQAVSTHEYEANQGVSNRHTLNHEALQAISNGFVIHIESIGYVQATTTNQIEAIGYVINAGSISFESLQGIAGSATLSHEALQYIANTLQIPFESLQGASVNVILNVVDKTAYFTIQLDKEIQFSKVLDKTITFH